MRKNIHTTKLIVLFFTLFIVLNSFAQTTTACWKSFAGGEFFSLGITSDGKLWSWGFNNFAQLGLGTQGNTANPNKAQVGTETDWKEVDAGLEYGLAIKENGTLWGWGANSFGMLGDGTGETRKSPVQIGTDANWSKISAGVVHTLALKSDGTLWAWGRNNEGQIGDGTYTIRAVPTQVGIDTDWTEISAGQRHSVAKKANGSLWAWGVYDNGQLGLGATSFRNINVPTQVGSSSDWNLISAGRNFNLAIKKDGTLWSWGQNDFGQLGNGASFGGSNVPNQIGTDTDWASIAAGDIHSMALKSDGTRWAWGSNGSGSNTSGSRGALGDSTFINKNIPIQIGTDTDWEKLKAGMYFSFCMKKDGTLWSNGRSFAGELGDGTSATVRLFPVLVSCPIVLTNIGIKDEIQDLEVYPNPVNDILWIKNYDKQSIKRISVFDFSGKLILAVNGNTDQINLDGIAKGIYVLQIFSEGKSYKKKIIKR